MKNPSSQHGIGAFTLVELLCVIAIIGILAALLLPALQKGKDRARLVGCESNLAELGIAFHAFSHDHGGKFPMQVSLTEGGAKEFVQNGYLVNGEFYFAFRNFQSLADELVTPKLLICPTDTRLAATNFVSLKNNNVSYFIGVNADYNQPQSILSGDRNLVTGPARSIYPAAGQPLRWSGIMHQFKGNLLFADGHVEESRGFSLAGNSGGLTAKNDFFLPSVKAEGIASPPASAGQDAGGRSSGKFPEDAGTANTHNAVPNTATNQHQPASMKPNVSQGQATGNVASADGPAMQAAAAPQTNGRLAAPASTNVVATADDELPDMPSFGHRAAKFFLSLIGWGILLILLLLLLLLAFLIWRAWQRRQARRQR